jgi:hypothetical protein
MPKEARSISSEVDPEKATNRCCEYMKITSEGLALELHPSVLGTYKNIKSNDQSPVYKQEGLDRFLARPDGLTETIAATFTWGVNSKLGARWGWIKAMEDQPCPHMVSFWGVFISTENRWARDATLEIKCSTRFGE